MKSFAHMAAIAALTLTFLSGHTAIAGGMDAPDGGDPNLSILSLVVQSPAAQDTLACNEISDEDAALAAEMRQSAYEIVKELQDARDFFSVTHTYDRWQELNTSHRPGFDQAIAVIDEMLAEQAGAGDCQANQQTRIQADADAEFLQVMRAEIISFRDEFDAMGGELATLATYAERIENEEADRRARSQRNYEIACDLWGDRRYDSIGWGRGSVGRYSNTCN